jgi:hypothetical protein
MGFLDQTVQSLICVPLSHPPRHALLYRARINSARFQWHMPLLIPVTLQRIVTHTCLRVVCSCSGLNHTATFLLWCFVGFYAFYLFFLYFPFPLYFVVLACWVEDVNNFLACESMMMSFDKRILLPMYRIESVWNRSVVTTEN